MALMTASAAAETWLRTQFRDDSPQLHEQIDNALAVIKRAASVSGARRYASDLNEQARRANGEELEFTPVAKPVASLLITFPDLDGNPVAFDPALVVGVRASVNKTARFSLVWVQPPGASVTIVYQVLEAAELVIDRINMHRRGLGEKLESALAALSPEAQDFAEDFSDNRDDLERQRSRREGLVE